MILKLLIFKETKIRILWLTNMLLPEASKLMSRKVLPFGGWFVATSKILSKMDNIELSVCSPDKETNSVIYLDGEKIKHCIFPPILNKEVKSEYLNKHLQDILNKINPHIIHIFGTEYPHTLAMVNLCIKMNKKTVISVQGLNSIIAKHYLTGIPDNIQKRFTVKGILKRENLLMRKKQFEKQGLLEIDALQKVNHIIGRTEWDKACSRQINKKAQYHVFNEILREEFYKHKWNINKCEKYSIFMSQASYPVKGLHYVIKAMPLIIEHFPETKLYIGGNDFIKGNSLMDRLKMTSYGKFVKDLIKKKQIQGHIIFNGIMNEKEMNQNFLRTHVFLSASSIENESNSLSEAKIIGVPCVASYVGGVTDRIKHGKDGFFYQHDAPYMLAHFVCKIFRSDDIAERFSENARISAKKINDPKNNINKLIKIYKLIYNE